MGGVFGNYVYVGMNIIGGCKKYIVLLSKYKKIFNMFGILFY